MEEQDDLVEEEKFENTDETQLKHVFDYSEFAKSIVIWRRRRKRMIWWRRRS